MLIGGKILKLEETPNLLYRIEDLNILTDLTEKHLEKYFNCVIEDIRRNPKKKKR